MSTFVTNGTVLTMDPDNRVIEEGTVRIDDEGTIDAVGRDLTPDSSDDVVDAHGGVIMPGFVNAHMHLYSTFSRGMAVPGPEAHDFEQVLESLWWQLDKALTLQDCYYSALIPACEAIRRGTTTLIDHHASPSAVEGSLETVGRALEEAGLRGVLAYEVSDRDGEEVRDEGLEENRRGFEFARDRNRLAALVGLHASFTLSEESLEEAADLVEEFDSGVHIHVAEGRNDEPHCEEEYGKRIVSRLDDHGLLTEKSLLAHCIHIDDGERDLLEDRPASVVHNPTSNMNNAVGAAPVLDLLERGIRVCLGTDGMSADPWTDLRTVSHLQNHAAGDPSTSFAEGVQMLLQNNPDFAGEVLDTSLGRLEEGYAGDVITLDYLPTSPLTSENLAGHLLFGMHPDQVRNTVVEGQILMENRDLLTVDEHDATRRARERAKAMWERLGVA